MSFPHSEDGQDQRINATNGTPYKWEYSKEISAKGIRDSPKGCLIPFLVPTNDHETEMCHSALDQEREDCHNRQCNRDDETEAVREG